VHHEVVTQRNARETQRAATLIAPPVRPPNITQRHQECIIMLCPCCQEPLSSVGKVIHHCAGAQEYVGYYNGLFIRAHRVRRIVEELVNAHVYAALKRQTAEPLA
jgi:hypothetical protein